MAELSPWLQLLYILAEEASGLRCIKIGWGAYSEFPEQLRQGARERGLGDNLDFVRALGKIRGLEKLVISGYYAKNWPAYLEERMGVRVRAMCGHYREERDLKEGDLNDEELEIEKLRRETNKKELQTFMEYQQGTEDLIPKSIYHRAMAKLGALSVMNFGYESAVLWDICGGFILWLPLKYDRCKNSWLLTLLVCLFEDNSLIKHILCSVHFKQREDNKAATSRNSCIKV